MAPMVDKVDNNLLNVKNKNARNACSTPGTE